MDVRRELLRDRTGLRSAFGLARNERAFREIEAEGPIGGEGETDAGGGNARAEAAAEGFYFGVFGDEDG